jgi:hypothetical protein
VSQVIAAPVLPDFDFEKWEVTQTDEDRAKPFILRLASGLWLPKTAEAPIGIYTIPRPRHTVSSSWPAEFHGPLPSMRIWCLLTPKGDYVVSAATKIAALPSIDTLELSVELTG